MQIKNIFRSITKKILFIIIGTMLVLVTLYYLWQKNKYGIVRSKITTGLIIKTDSLYSIKYDSLFFDELTGSAFLKNVRIIPDTNRIKNKPLNELPYAMLEINVSSILVKGVKTDKALIGTKIIGDSILIEDPKIIVYFLKSLKKETKIDAEAEDLYKQILGNLDLIQVKDVIIKNSTVQGISLSTHQKEFDLANTNIRLFDVKIDSSSNEDTSRTLFCKEASFNISEFTAFNNERVLISVSDINFSGKSRILSFTRFALNRFESDSSKSISLLEMENMLMTGVNSNEAVKNKNISIDKLTCGHISFYRPPAVAVKPKPTIVKDEVSDTSGFRKVYAIKLDELDFPDIDVLEDPANPVRNNFKIGKFSVKIKGIKADQLLEMQLHPFAYIKEADLFCKNISYNTPDHLYKYDLQNIRLNSLLKQISVESFKLTPGLNEAAFTRQARVQKDRYDISLNGISLEGLNMDKLLEKQIFANALKVGSSSIKIYRDISYPLSGESKVGNYPHQMLIKSEAPIDIRHLNFDNLDLQYKEKNALSNQSGVINFERSSVNIDNLTNVQTSIKQNNIMSVAFKSNVLGQIPLTANFKFFLSSTDGKFAVNGSIGSCSAGILNSISVPMALIKIDAGNISGASFNFTGNDVRSSGDFVMKYTDFKVALLKKNEDKTTKKRGFLSAIANTFVKNENPRKGKLRSYSVDYERDKQKSFFNLVWKSIFSGMQATFGMPTNNAKEK